MNVTNRAPRVSGGALGGALGSRVLAERNPAVAAVGVWVENGSELQEDPATLASVTEQRQQQRRLRSENQLRLFQENVRLRVAEQGRRRGRARPGSHTQETAGHTLHSDEAPLRLTAHKELSPDQDRSVEGGWSRGVLWPLDRSEELRRQRQNQILTQRRLFLSQDRQNVKEHEEHKRHVLKTASLKQQKERVRLEEERLLGEERLLSEAQQTLEQRELQVQETLRTEAVAEDRGKRQRQASKTNRQISALREQLRVLFSDSELPPLCCCGSFWDTHPNSCANNCPFHHDPRAYIQALQSVVHSWQLL